ncbi:MAG TPA: flagellar basal-body rod protein FlgF [Xanthobacteraceae bacterium]|jgi:flagellar basal-body rod protein FlgF/flagellar basal-body rod protein FlgG|nr:flagellar basal-body rod protein FlgF [Xanthobacteraceae bacterium]
MENALLVGLSRQMALSHELDIVANNIANINTTGYKADNLAFSQFLMPNASDDQFTGSDRRLDFVQDRGTWIDFAPGAVQRTGSPLDVAIDGNAYLAVQTPRGVRYTRNGALSVNGTGQLVTSDGYQVLGDSGPITFQSTDHDVIISPSGIITVREGNNTADSPRGRLQLVGFDQPQLLQKDGGSVFAPPPGVNATPAPQGARVLQGSIEKSNVNSLAEISRMIQITRSYTDIANVLQQQSEQRRNALSQLSQVPASGTA